MGSPIDDAYEFKLLVRELTEEPESPEPLPIIELGLAWYVKHLPSDAGLFPVTYFDFVKLEALFRYDSPRVFPDLVGRWVRFYQVGWSPYATLGGTVLQVEAVRMHFNLRDVFAEMFVTGYCVREMNP
jgi:hypothetical protein